MTADLRDDVGAYRITRTVTFGMPSCSHIRSAPGAVNNFDLHNLNRQGLLATAFFPSRAIWPAGDSWPWGMRCEERALNPAAPRRLPN